MDPRTHPHPPPPTRWDAPDADVIVVGGGHAGLEAALAARRLGARVMLISLRLDLIGEMSCNPAIGGLGKGQIVREVDALGGGMGRLADDSGIQFRMLNTGKGAAVQAPRCQSDRHRYRELAGELVREDAGLALLEGGVADLLLEQAPGSGSSRGARPWVRGVRMQDGRELWASAVILTTGTFMGAVMHTGSSTTSGGRVGEGTSSGLTRALLELDLSLSRLKTGTPPRLDANSLDFTAMEEQRGDGVPRPFSFETDSSRFPSLPQVPCHVTHTCARTHQIIRENIHLAPMYSGRIKGVGPRYCPSVEDKVMRFADREQHQVFVEPEGLETDVIYVNGVSTSLPAGVQEAFVRSIPGLEQARFVRHGYAVEYDHVQPSQLSDTLAVARVPGLFLAGQINGTSGYEEAAGQGLVAGANAALWVQDRAPFLLERHEAYVGVMVDDLVVTQPSEPYRMFTSRAEYRLLLRADNADRRLTPRAAQIGLVGPERAAAVERKQAAVERALEALDGQFGQQGRTLTELLRRPHVDLALLAPEHPLAAEIGRDPELAETVEIEVKYAGYVVRQEESVRRLARQESTEIPAQLDYSGLQGLASEAREKLALLRPRTLGAAARIEGVRPPDVALLAVHVERFKRLQAQD